MIGVIGYGRSGKAVASLIEGLGMQPFISDSNEKITDIPYPHETGEHSDRLLQMEMLVVSPGVPKDVPILKKAEEEGIPVIGEMEFASRHLRGKIVGITGTNGKTTTVALTHHVLEENLERDILIGGNIYPGEPLSSLVERSSENSITVVEVSSFQLERITDFKPWVAAITNITPDHLNRHSDFNEYVNAKLRIFENQDGEDYALINRDEKNIKNICPESRKLYFSMKHKSDMYFNGDAVRMKDGRKLFRKKDLFFPGQQFVQDAMISSLVGEIAGIDRENIIGSTISFTGVIHRMETVIRRGSLWVINNSMCTNPEAFRKSLESFPDSCVIVGGRMKVEDITPITESIVKWANFAVLIGESSGVIAEELRIAGYSEFETAESMEKAVKIAKNTGNKKVMLSPGGSSFDWYENFSERGEDFKTKVKDVYGE